MHLKFVRVIHATLTFYVVYLKFNKFKIFIFICKLESIIVRHTSNLKHAFVCLCTDDTRFGQITGKISKIDVTIASMTVLHVYKFKIRFLFPNKSE